MFRLTLIMIPSNSFPFVFLSFIPWLALGNSPVCDNSYRRISGNITKTEPIIFPSTICKCGAILKIYIGIFHKYV